MTESKPTKVESSPMIFSGNPQKKRYKNCPPFIPRASKLIGRTDKIKNDIFDVPDGRNPKQFSKMVEAIANYILKEYKNGMACGQTIRDMTPATLEESRRPDDLNNPVKLVIFNEEVREYVKDEKSFKG
jgi:hypothetical protein